LPETHTFAFAGTGAEYFRIWIVNLCLSIATFGLYSPWAKVRRLQYFARNTQLAGAVFDFHGDPKAILKGRLVALTLLLAYHYAFDFSLTAGFAVIGVLLFALPWLMRSALRFRLSNTSYRGLRFGFAGTVTGAYRSYGLVILLFLLPTMIAALAPGRPGLLFGSFLVYLAWPVLHAQMKRYQHNGFIFGNSRASAAISTGEFFARYFFAALIGVSSVLAGGIVIALVSLGVGGAKDGSMTVVLVPMVGTVLNAYVVYLLSIPFLQARIWSLVWSATAFPNVSVQSDMRAGAFIKLQMANTLLTVLTLGLYRPFAVVRAYRYRLTCMSLTSTGNFNSLLAAEPCRGTGAQGDGTADFLGFDLSW
jgi:uncharacterized membrane protein YjgN (DUF898 family)